MSKASQRWTKHIYLRDHPLTIQEKRRLREEMQFKNLNKTFLGPWQNCGQCSYVHPTLEQLQQILRACKLWERTLISIRARFGSGISSYFSFLRFLILLNLVSLVFTFGLLVVPTIVFTKEGAGQTPSDAQCINFRHQNSTKGVFIDLFTGEGFLRNSLFFYGYYSEETTDLSLFDIRLAYLLIPLVYLLLCGLYLLRCTVQGITTRRVRSRDYKTPISTKVFSSWDFCAQGLRMSSLKQQSLSYEIKSHLAEELWLLDFERQAVGRRACVITTRVLINCVIMALLGGAFYSVHLATGVSSQDYHKIEVPPILGLLRHYLVPFVISLVHLILPRIFTLLVRFEGHSPSAEITLTLIRYVFLKLGTLGILFFSLGQKILCFGSAEPSCGTCGYNTDFECWETSVGQEFYKLSLFHFLYFIMDFLVFQVPRSFLVSRVKLSVIVWLGKEKFHLPQNVLDTVYGQTLVWGGLLYAPLLPLLNIIFLIITFYVKKFSLYRLCAASQKLFRVSSSRILFYFVLLLGLITTYCPLIYMVTSVRPSRTCGLFTNHSTQWESVQHSMWSSLSPGTNTIVNYITSTYFPFTLLIVFSITLTSYFSNVRQYEQMIDKLKDNLSYQILDKQFLVRRLKEEDNLKVTEQQSDGS
ncbi:transmembrane channel 8 isoform X1 [Pelobates cultripes]|uniref:Transmembrane channel-like protein n=1 Tax=Pelobates cultripes TaxID=61616 RepID=A0AAD1S3F6_PELCU|nr:transmembrane channel 8 isoform X1 [Pelobates cultripes]